MLTQGVKCDGDGPAYIHVFVTILRDIFKEETVEYVLALIDEMLTANPRRARLFDDNSLSNEDTYGPFLRLLWKGNWFIQEKSCKILSLIVSARPNFQNVVDSNGDASNSKRTLTTKEDVLNGLVEWMRAQLLYETCLCVCLLSYYEPAIEYLATSRTLPRLIEVVKGSTEEKGTDMHCFSKYFTLPDAHDGLPALFDKINTQPGFLNHHVPFRKVIVSKFLIPKFKKTFEFEASNILKRLGLTLPKFLGFLGIQISWKYSIDCYLFLGGNSWTSMLSY